MIMTTGVQTPQQAAVQDATDVRNAAANGGDQGIRAASQALFTEAGTFMGSDAAVNPADKARYLGTLTTRLEQDGLLPAITIDYANQKFKDLNTGGKTDANDIRLDAAEVEAAARNAKVGTLDYILLNKLNDMIKSGAIKDSMTQEQLGRQLKDLEVANRAKMAKEAGEVLKDKKLFDKIDVAVDPKQDGVIGQQDIEAYLKTEEGKNLPEETKAKLDYLAKNWNSQDVRALQYEDPNKKDHWYIKSDTLTSGLASLAHKAMPAEIKPPPPAERPTNEEERKIFKNGATTVTEFPDGHSLTVETMPGTDQTINITEGHKLPNGEMHYTGWRYNAQDKKWTKYDGEKPIMDADSVRVRNGKVEATGQRPAWGTVSGDPDYGYT
jgi:hypothetical protein